MSFLISPLGPGHDLDALWQRPDALGCPYRHHGHFTDDELAAITASEIRSRLEGESVSAFVCEADGVVAALCVCSRLDWDSDYFGMPVARLELWRLPGAEAAVVRELVDRTLGDAMDRLGARHIHCRVDADDYGFANALIASGFCLHDAQRIYVATRPRLKVPRREIYKPDPYRPELAPALLELFSGVAFDSRYTRDASLPVEKTKRMYGQWVSNLLGLQEQEREIYVLERNGGVVAAGAGRYVDFSRYGIRKKIMTDGIFASRKGFSGAYIGITRAVVEDALDNGCAFVELKVSANNHPANRVLQSLGYEGVPQFYYFHKCI